MGARFVFVHGMGAAGADNWPMQIRTFPDAAYLRFPGWDDDSTASLDTAIGHVKQHLGEPCIVIAHSFGAIPTILAMSPGEVELQGLVLLEPALYSLARGEDAIEQTIDRLSPVYSAAANQDATEFGTAFHLALTGTPFDPTPETMRWAERIKAFGPPWAVEIDRSMLPSVPTLTITGGWNADYEAIGSRLASAGSHWLKLAGHGHRIADHRDFNRRLARFAAATGRR